MALCREVFGAWVISLDRGWSDTLLHVAGNIAGVGVMLVLDAGVSYSTRVKRALMLVFLVASAFEMAATAFLLRDTFFELAGRVVRFVLNFMAALLTAGLDASMLTAFVPQRTGDEVQHGPDHLPLLGQVRVPGRAAPEALLPAARAAADAHRALIHRGLALCAVSFLLLVHLCASFWSWRLSIFTCW